MEWNIKIIGEVSQKPKFFLFSEGKRLLAFIIKVGRGNNDFDSLPVFVDKEILDIRITKGMKVEVNGYIRKFKDQILHTGIMAMQVSLSEEGYTNEVKAVGRVLKCPISKKIKEKNLLFVKVSLEVYSEQNNSPEYLTAFAVGNVAISLKKLKENEWISFNGNLQSRIGGGDGKRYFEVKIYHFDKI